MTATIAAPDEIVTPCQERDPERWFAPVDSETARRSKELCMQHCPIYHQCAAYALENGIPFGIWGGMDERERERVWKRAGGRPATFIEDLDRALAGAAFYERRGKRFTSGFSVGGAA